MAAWNVRAAIGEDARWKGATEGGRAMSEASPMPWSIMRFSSEDEPYRIVDANGDEVAIELLEADATLIVDAVGEYTRRENWRKKYIDRRVNDAARIEGLYADISDLEVERDKLRDLVRRLCAEIDVRAMLGSCDDLLREARTAIGEGAEKEGGRP